MVNQIMFLDRYNESKNFTITKLPLGGSKITIFNKFFGMRN